MIRTFAALLLLTGLLFGQNDPVDMTVGPSVHTVEAGDSVTVSLTLSSEGQGSLVAFDLVMRWDPSKLALVNAEMDPAYDWLIAGFLNDTDGFNDDPFDGDAVFTALVPITQPLSVPPSATVLHLTFIASESGVVEFPRAMGTYATTKVVGTAPGTVVTGTTPQSVLVEVEPPRSRVMMVPVPFFGPIVIPFNPSALL